MSRGLVDDDRQAHRIAMVVANAWLLFLLFPLLTVLADDVSGGRKIASTIILGLFAIAHTLGYRAMIRREFGLDEATAEASAGPLANALTQRVAWFVVMVVLCGAGLAVGGWAMLGMTPFLVSYGIFQFPWRIGMVIFGVTLAVALVAPAIAGVLDDLWFFAIIVGSVGIGTLLIRISEERQAERATFQTRLALSDERHRLARDVHDVLGHSLTAVILKGQVIDRMLQRLDSMDAADALVLDQAREQLAELDSVSRRALAEIRSTVGGLRSADLADELTAARAVLADAGVALTVTGDVGGVDQQLRPVLGWVVREAVTNVVRHARADHCTIDIGNSSDVLLRITDDGVGFGSSFEGNGLSGLRERVLAAGVGLRVGPGVSKTAPANGTGRTGTLLEVTA